MAMLNDLGGDLVNPFPDVSPMLSPSGDPELDQIRQKMFAQNAAMQTNQMPLQLSMPDTAMMQPVQETMTMPETNGMLTQPQNIMQAAASQLRAEPSQTPFADYAKANWQDLLQSGVAGLEDNAMRENLPADIYIKMKSQENEKVIAEQDRLLKNLQMQADIEYQRQSLELKREELAMERQRVLMGDTKPTALMQNYDFIKDMMPNANPVDILPFATGTGLSQGVDYDPATGAVNKPVKPMPASATNVQNEYIADLSTAEGTKQNIDKFLSQINTGKLDFGMIDNAINKARNFANMSNEESRNLSSFQSSLEKMRNDSLRLNTGVQTDGDAQRAWNELFQNLNDKDLVKQRLEEIKGINERGAALKKLQIETLRQNFGQPEFDYSKTQALPSLNPQGLSPEKQQRLEELRRKRDEGTLK